MQAMMIASDTSPSLSRSDGRVPLRSADRSCIRLTVDSIGYLVPRTGFEGSVHSIFARACNIASGSELLTLAAPEMSDGPTTLRLSAVPADLRSLFRPGDRLRSSDGCMRSSGVSLDLRDAVCWCPAPRRPCLEARQVAANLGFARARLGALTCVRASIIDREGSIVAAALEQACRDLDGPRALPQVDRLIGWGEGLTPAGDDFLVGLLAGLDALAGECDERGRWMVWLCACISARRGRTTPVAAHYLGLALRGHFTADVVRLRDALLAERDPRRLEAALEAILAVGATSGSDTVAGLLAGCEAWPSSSSNGVR
jgi:hypothetical protein